ncbi:MAG: AI-2E family transporter [Solitalea-like symbiont of Acarus siro]
MPTFTYKQRSYIVLIIILLMGAFLLYTLRSVLSSFLGAIILYTIFRQLNIYLTERRQWNRSLTSLLIIILSFFMIVLPCLILILMVINKASIFTQDTHQLKEILAYIDKMAAEKLQKPHFTQDAFAKIQNMALSFFSSVVSSFLNILLWVSVMYFILYFMLVQYKSMEEKALQYMPFPRRTSLRFAHEMKNMTYANVLGQGVIAIIQGTALAICFLIFGIKDAVFWGVLGIFVSFIPVLGTPLIFVPIGIIELANHHIFKGVGILVYGFIIVVNIDNVIRYFIAKKISNTHPLIAIIGVITGVPIFGILGLVYGPLMFSFFLLMLDAYRESHIVKDDGTVVYLKDAENISQDFV